MAGHVKRSPPDANTELVQVRVSKEARALIEAAAKAEALSVASHVRRVLYRSVGLIEGES